MRGQRPISIWIALITSMAAHVGTNHARAGGDSATFAVIGDYGADSAEEAAVAGLITNVLKPEFIVTVGDNNYGAHTQAGYDAAIGQYYSQYIGSYTGQYGPGSPVNRFWPALGNHDWSDTTGYQAYLDYFTLPGNERTYDVVQGPVHLFIINSDSHEPSGISSSSEQALWLQSALAASTSPWNFVVLHHAPYSSGTEHGSNATLQWPFAQWGADAVLAGHDHDYERLEVSGIPYFVNGLGGRSIYELDPPLPQTVVRYNQNYGAMRVIATATHVTFQFWSIANGGTLVDSLTIPAANVSDLIPLGSAWKYLDNGSDQGSAWRQPNFDDAAWASGPAQLGYGDGDEATVVSYGPNPSNKYVTTYFRRQFQVNDIPSIASLVMSTLRDDGAVVYINGTEVFRTNLPAAPAVITYQSLGLGAIGGADESALYDVSLDPCVLVSGLNVMAVEIHQSSGTSSDISFDMRLSTSLPAPPVCIVLCPADVDGSGTVNILDLLAVIAAWGSAQGGAADVNDDGTVDILDLLALVGQWGSCV